MLEKAQQNSIVYHSTFQVVPSTLVWRSGMSATAPDLRCPSVWSSPQLVRFLRGARDEPR
jgi:hypothetical protein